MKRSKIVLIIAACLFLVVSISSSLYIYHKIDQILSASNLQLLIGGNSQDKLSTFNTPKAPEDNLKVQSPSITNEQQPNPQIFNADENISNVQHNNQQIKQATSSDSASVVNPALSNKIASTLEKEAGKPVDTADMIKAGYILMGKLNNDEINFLFGFSDKKYTSEELKKAREILFSKLSSQDIETLQALAGKYGKNIYLLDPSVPIK